MVHRGKASTPRAGDCSHLAKNFRTTKRPLDTGIAVVLNENDGAHGQLSWHI